MNDLIAKYPSLVARPYMMIKDDLQKKDMQRFWFENTISFLATVVGAELIVWYKELKNKENKSEKELEIIKKLQNHPSLTNVGLEHMSLGKWVMMLRETTKLLDNLKVDMFCPEIIDFFKKNEQIINKLVEIRNKDAHGNPIPEDKLSEELNKRQELIDKLVIDLEFLKNYKLMFIENLEIENNFHYFVVKTFLGNNIITSKIKTDAELQIGDLVLFKDNNYLSLYPHVIYAGMEDESKNFIGIFSKYTDKNKTKALYFDVRGNIEIDLKKYGKEYDFDFIKEKREWEVIYSSPEINKVNLDVKFKFLDKSINVNEISSFQIILDNTKSTVLKNVDIYIDIPNHIQILNLDEIDNTFIEDSRLVMHIDEISDEIIELPEINFKISTQGLFTIEKGIVSFDYYKTFADEEANKLTNEYFEFDGDVVEVIDPASKDKIIPVINVKKRFLNLELKEVDAVKIGKDFIFELEIKNIGFSIAKNISIEVVFPEELKLKNGQEIINVTQLNPKESQTFQYVFNTYKAGIYNITTQNIIYQDINDKRYLTKCSDEYFIIVKSDILTEFKYKIYDFIKDLYIDEEEQKEINKTIKEITEKLNIDGKKFYEDNESNIVINIVSDIVGKIAKKKNIKIIKNIYKENKNDIKITNEKSREFLVFSHNGFPFFAIDLKLSGFWGMRTNINKRFDKVEEKLAVMGKGSYTLDHFVSYDLVRNTEKYSVEFIYQWINMILSKVIKEYVMWKKVSDLILRYGNDSYSYVSGQFSRWRGEDFYRECMSFIDRNRSQHYYFGFGIMSKNNKFYRDKIKELNFLKFIIRKKMEVKEIRIYNKEQLSYYYRLVENKLTYNPLVYQKITNEEQFKQFVKKTDKLFYNLEHVKGLNEMDSLIENEELKNQLIEFSDDIFKKYGFSIRKNKFKNNEFLEIYGLKHVEPYKINNKHILARIYPRKDKLEFSLKFIKDYDTNLNLKINERLVLNNIWDIENIIKTERLSSDKIKDVLEIIDKQIEAYNTEAKFIVPTNLQYTFVSNVLNSEYFYFFALEKIKENKEIDNALLKLLKTRDNLYNSVNFKHFIELDDENIIIPSVCQKTIQNILNSLNNILMPNSRSIRIKLLYELKNKINIFTSRANTYLEPYIDKFISIKNDFAKRLICVMRVSQSDIKARAIFEKVKNVKDLETKLSEYNIQYEIKKDNIDAYVILEYDSIENIDTFSKKINDFYNKILNLV